MKIYVVQEYEGDGRSEILKVYLDKEDALTYLYQEKGLSAMKPIPSWFDILEVNCEAYYSKEGRIQPYE